MDSKSVGYALGAGALGWALGRLIRREEREASVLGQAGTFAGRDQAIDRMCGIAEDFRRAFLSDDVRGMENLRQAFNSNVPQAMIFGRSRLEFMTLFETLRMRCPPGLGGYLWSLVAPHVIRAETARPPAVPTVYEPAAPYVSPIPTPTGRAIPPEIERMLPPSGITTTPVAEPTPPTGPGPQPVPTTYIAPRTYALPEIASVARAFEPVYGQLRTPEETATEALRRHQEWLRSIGLTPTQAAATAPITAPAEPTAQAECPPGTVMTAQGCVATPSRFPGLQRLLPLVGGLPGGGGIQAPSLGGGARPFRRKSIFG